MIQDLLRSGAVAAEILIGDWVRGERKATADLSTPCAALRSLKMTVCVGEYLRVLPIARCAMDRVHRVEVLATPP
jgi:hypothetical protein